MAGRLAGLATCDQLGKAEQRARSGSIGEIRPFAHAGGAVMAEDGAAAASDGAEAA
jgi:hypothetical protein